ncbi:5730_t:CDS:2 [Gigaspora rosea]|nr:5730_t:CDS:2 [Gigaspora rosea]
MSKACAEEYGLTNNQKVLKHHNDRDLLILSLSFSQAIKIPSVVKVKKWKQSDVIKYLQSKKNDLDLKDEYINIIGKQDISGPEFLKLTKEELKMVGMPIGPAIRIVDHTQKLSSQLKSFSKTVEIEKYDFYLQRCLDYIKGNLKNMGPLVGRKEAVYSRYIEIILQHSLCIANEITEKHVFLEPECEIIGVEASGDVDYTFRLSKISSGPEEVVCITKAKRNTEEIGIVQNIVQLESAF